MEFGYGNFTGTSVLSFFYSVWAHSRIDGKRIEIVEEWYPKRLPDDPPRAQGHLRMGVLAPKTAPGQAPRHSGVETPILLGDGQLVIGVLLGRPWGMPIHKFAVGIPLLVLRTALGGGGGWR